jgi:hypothetical protein
MDGGKRWITGIEKPGGEDAPKKDEPRKEEPRKDEPKKDEPARDGDKIRLLEGRFVKVEKGEDAWWLIIKVEGKNQELRITWDEAKRKQISEVLAKLKPDYLIGVGFLGVEEKRVVQWIVLIKGGDVDKREAWEREKKSAADKPREGDKKDGERRSFVGFAGQVRGVVGDRGDTWFALKVARVLKVWKGSGEGLAGKTIKIRAGNDLQARFIQRLEEGEELSIEVKHVDGDLFEITELTDEQRERAGKGD